MTRDRSNKEETDGGVVLVSYIEGTPLKSKESLPTSSSSLLQYYIGDTFQIVVTNQ